MKKSILIISAIIFISLIGIINAATDTNDADNTFQINTFIDYKKACFNNGTYCSSAASCNYTIFNPDNSILASNLQATNNNSYHNATFYVSNNGLHQIDMICDDDGERGAATFWMEVTGDGLHNTIWFYVLIIFFSFGVILLGFYLSDAPMVILGTFGLYFLGIYVIRFGIVGIKDLTTTWASGIILLSLAAYISTKSAYELIVE